MNGPSYLEFLRDDLDRELEIHRNELEMEWEALEDVLLAHLPMIWFQRDGAPPHITFLVHSHLNATFPNRWLGRFEPQPWPARSPDLALLDFFLWGYIKERVFVSAYESEQEMQDCITYTFQQLRNSCNEDPTFLPRLHTETLRRANVCERLAALELRGSRPAPCACVSICRDALLWAVRRSRKIVLKSAKTGGRQLTVLRARVIKNGSATLRRSAGTRVVRQEKGPRAFVLLTSSKSTLFTSLSIEKYARSDSACWRTLAMLRNNMQWRADHMVEVAFASRPRADWGPYHTYARAYDLHEI
ncbi:hypothetical protein EVAR_63299_1 [Eumeta japonica]|uniref:Uncharacterized protein n=1 Tax=Eumeta variegata TaxID=151549 RepID=A0A4C1ZQK8_EUMVA|nr:hypothetical protein EVAR_63299_1 [Eumeta japonica]